MTRFIGARLSPHVKTVYLITIIAVALLDGGPSSGVNAQQVSTRSPNPPSPPAALAYDACKYRDLNLSFNSSNNEYIVSPIQKAFRLYLNMSYSLYVEKNNTIFVSSIRDALSLFFQVWSVLASVNNTYNLDGNKRYHVESPLLLQNPSGPIFVWQSAHFCCLREVCV